MNTINITKKQAKKLLKTQIISKKAIYTAFPELAEQTKR